MHIALFGHESYAHSIALSRFPKARIHFCSSQDDLFTQLENCDFGIAPLYDRGTGYNEETIFHLMQDRLCVIAKETTSIAYHLAGYEMSDALFCHPTVFTRCKQSLQEICPHCEVIYTTSNAESAEKALQDRGLALIPSFAQGNHKLPLIAEDIHDEKPCEMTYLYVAKKGEPLGTASHTLFLLSELSEEFTEEMIRELFDKSAIKIEFCDTIYVSEIGEEVFLVESAGSYRDPNFAELLQELAENCRVKVLGEYEGTSL